MTVTRRLALGVLGASTALPGVRRAVAAADGAIVISRAARPVPAPLQHFTGPAEVTAAFRAPAPARASGGVITFAPGSRTDWHTHPLGQTLIVLSGIGLVQRWGEAAEPIGPGDIAWIPPGTKHWHGAGTDGPMCHVAVSEVQDGTTVDWLEKVSADQYAAALGRP